jgi:hypothetical protein
LRRIHAFTAGVQYIYRTSEPVHTTAEALFDRVEIRGIRREEDQKLAVSFDYFA